MKTKIVECRPVGLVRWVQLGLLQLLAGCTVTAGGGDAALERQFERRGVDVAIEPPAVVSYFEAGPADGRAVIYVHGTPGTAGAWVRYLENPVGGLRAISYDRPGFGGSRPRRAYPSLADQAAALDALVPTDGAPILVGHSLGGPIVCWFAAEHPERVGGLVLVSASMDPGLERVRFIQRMAKVPPFEWVVPRDLRLANEEVLPLERELEELGPMLSRIRCPIVIVHGTKDGLVPYGNVAYMEEAFSGNPSVRVVTLEGGSHFVPWENEGELRAVIGEMVGEVEGR